MKKADLKVGFSCNNNCRFCVQGAKKKFGDKKTEELKRLIKVAFLDSEIIVFTGGEPTIREDIFELVGFAKKCGFETIQIQSNGRMFAYKEFCRKILKAGANEFALALHGHIPELHDWLTQSKGAFCQTVSGIKNLIGFRQNVIMNTVICKSNYRHLPEIAKLLIGLGVKQYQFAFVHALGNAAQNFDSVVPRMSMVAPYVIKGLEIGKQSGIKAMVEAIPFCFLGGYEDCISENIMPDTKIFDLDTIIPDYKKSRIAEGKLKGPRCKKCKYYKICEGPWREYPERFGWEEFQPVRI